MLRRPAPFFLLLLPCCSRILQSTSFSVHSAPISVHLCPLAMSTSSPLTSNPERPSSAHSSSVLPASRRVFDGVRSWALPFLGTSLSPHSDSRHFARVGPVGIRPISGTSRSCTL
ncbi:hypothetical protein FB451DRAFT_1217550, partial [Mycena latifolia]